MSEHEDHRALDAQRHASYLDHTQRASDVAGSPRPGRTGAAKRFIRRLVDAASPRQAEFNVESSAALSDLHDLVSRFDLRISGLEENSTKLWAAVGPSGGDNATRALFASHDLVLEDLSEQVTSMTKAIEELATFASDTDLVANAVDELKTSTNAGLEEAKAKTTADLEGLETDLGSRISDSNKTLETAVGSTSDDVQRIRGELANTRAQVEILLHEFRAKPEMVSRTAAQAHEVRISEVYARFEDRFRGSREHVLSLLKDYESDLERLGKHGRVLDIGSGRGEFLELLAEEGIDAYGVDTSKTFVEQTTKRDLHVLHGDALDHLSNVPSGSLGAVTGFHIAEHIPIPTLIELLDRCIVALAPGGRVLFETPNPTNLLVGAANFYLDPTHLRPLHPDLLGFLVADRGFVDVEIRYLHPGRPDLSELDDASTTEVERSIRWAMFGPQDVAVLATKPGAGSD